MKHVIAYLLVLGIGVFLGWRYAPPKEPVTANVLDSAQSLAVVKEESPMVTLGLRASDVLIRVNEVSVNEHGAPAALSEAESALSRGHLCATYKRGEQTREVCLNVKS